MIVRSVSINLSNQVNSSQCSFKVTPPHHNFFTCFVLDGGDCCGDAADNRDVDERELRDEEENNLEVTPITFNGEGELGTLHQVAYYENPGILMIVQSVGDQEGSKLNQGEITAHHKRSRDCTEERIRVQNQTIVQ